MNRAVREAATIHSSLGEHGIRSVYWGAMAYEPAVKMMDEAQRDRIAGAIPDTIIYLEHEPVITYGRATPREHLSRLPHKLPMVEVNRGGLATYHGFGQLVGYPILDLRNRADGRKPDIHDYLRALESGLSAYLETAFRLTMGPVAGLTGVWVEHESASPRKVASIGISARKWVTAHGFALNLSPNLHQFECIVPCGIVDHEMTSVAKELERRGDLGVAPSPRSAVAAVHRHLCAALHGQGWCLPGGTDQ